MPFLPFSNTCLEFFAPTAPACKSFEQRQVAGAVCNKCELELVYLSRNVCHRAFSHGRTEAILVADERSWPWDTISNLCCVHAAACESSQG